MRSSKKFKFIIILLRHAENMEQNVGLTFQSFQYIKQSSVRHHSLPLRMRKKNNKMSRYSKVMKAVKDVLENDEEIKKVCSFKQVELEELTKATKTIWRLSQLLENADYQKNTVCHVPEDLNYLFLTQEIRNGKVDVSILKAVHDTVLNERNYTEDLLIKERIEHMLQLANFNITDFKDVHSKLEEYENVLSFNNRGYSLHYKRDVAETMVNTYNPEWISTWNGNMDIQQH